MSKPVSVEVYTSSHRVLGRVEAGPSGLYSHLNLPTTSIIEVDGAHLNRLHQPGRLVSRYTSRWLVKREIVAVLLSNRAEVGSVSMSRGGFTTTVPHWIHVLLGGYELRGLFETAGKFNAGATLFEGDRPFIPLYTPPPSAPPTTRSGRSRNGTPACRQGGSMVLPWLAGAWVLGLAASPLFSFPEWQ